jgi:hypothetical protein
MIVRNYEGTVMATDLDPKTQSQMLFRAIGIMLPVVLLLLGALTAVLGEDGDVFTVGILLVLCGLGWLIYGLSRASRPHVDQDWPMGRL